MLTKTLKVETDNHLNIMESVKKLAASSGQPLIVIDGEGTLLYINVLGKEVLKKKGRSRMMRKIFSFFSFVSYLAYNDNYYEMERIADFRTKENSLHCLLYTSPDSGFLSFAMMFVVQFSVGGALGFAFGFAGAWVTNRIKLNSDGPVSYTHLMVPMKPVFIVWPLLHF